MARPTKLTEETVDKITRAIRAGNHASVSARLAGIGETTYYRWMADGEKDDAEPEYREFWESIKRAEAEAEIRSVALIRQAAEQGTWQASAWYLERKHPERWGKNDKLRQEISGPNGEPLQITLDDAKKAVLQFLEEGAEENESITLRPDSAEA
jgi:hypothetical protein